LRGERVVYRGEREREVVTASFGNKLVGILMSGGCWHLTVGE